MIVDGHCVTRRGLRAMLATDHRIDVIGEAMDGFSALQFIRSHQPDIAVMDTKLPKLSGIDTARVISERHLGTKVLFLSADASCATILEALNAGADGYILNDCELSDLGAAIKCLAAGQAYLSPVVTRHIIGEYVKHSECRECSANVHVLTLRERQILQLVCEGESNKQTAKLLNIAVKTVEKHRSSMKRKLNLSSTQELFNYWENEINGNAHADIRRNASDPSARTRVTPLFGTTDAANKN